MAFWLVWEENFVDILIWVDLYIMCFYTLTTLKIFLFFTRLQQFDLDVPWCGFLCVYLT